jgi:uncharacterized membrane protein YebE (DUF533 family)
MVEYRKLLDAIVSSLGRAAPSAGGKTSAAVQEQAGQTTSASARSDQLLQKAKDLAAQHPALAQAAVVGLAGLLFRSRKGGLSGGLVKLGGLAVIGGLAYRAIQSRKAVQPSDSTGSLQAFGTGEFQAPPGTRFHPTSQTEDDALLLVRTMIAAASADGKIDERERSRILKGMAEAGIDPQSNEWLEDELASPADIDALAGPVNDRETASQVYAAARITIDPDTLQEREFLRRLADALDLDAPILQEIDSAVSELRKS